MMRKYQLVQIGCSMSRIINITELVAIDSYFRNTMNRSLTRVLETPRYSGSPLRQCVNVLTWSILSEGWPSRRRNDMSESLTRIRAILATTPQRWNALVAALPDEVLRERPSPAEWSALECLEHLLD